MLVLADKESNLMPSKPSENTDLSMSTLTIPSISSVMQTPNAEEPKPGSRPTDF
jgi:hypothetical protein